MKKIIAALAALTLMSAVNVYAGQTDLELVTPEKKLQVGDVFNVELDVTENTGFTTFDALVVYDPEVVELIGGGDVADDTLCYTNSSNMNICFIDDKYIDSMIKIVPQNNDRSYAYRGNGKDTAGKIGAVKLSNYVTEADENRILKQVTGTGTLCTMKFRAVANGETDIEIRNCSFATIIPSDKWESSASASITVGRSSTNDTTEHTTKRAESTTKKSQSTTMATTTKATTTEATTETTTVQVTTTTETTTETTTQADITFNDTADFPWAEEYIADLAARGVINGYSDGSFKPSDNVKRCDFVIMLVKALNVENGTDNFSDVPEDAYYASAVSAAKAAGITHGNGDGTFSPDSYITRQDMMIMVRGALAAGGIETAADLSALDKFTDNADISDYAKESVSAMVSAGIVTGTGSNVEPKGNTTRAQAAVIISKVISAVENN